MAERTDDHKGDLYARTGWWQRVSAFVRGVIVGQAAPGMPVTQPRPVGITGDEIMLIYAKLRLEQLREKFPPRRMKPFLVERPFVANAEPRGRAVKRDFRVVRDPAITQTHKNTD